jgi:ribosomal protein L19E
MDSQSLQKFYLLKYPEVQDAFLKAMENVIDRAMLDEMIKAVEAGDVDALFRATGFDPAVLVPVLESIEQVFKETTDIAVESWPSRITTASGAVIAPIFNMRNPAVEQQLREFSSQFITRITEEARNNVRQVMQQGMVKGENPRKVALDIVGRINPVTKKREGGIIGLTAQQEQWSANVTRYLQQSDPRYFQMSLRDKRFDSIVKKAFDEGKPLNAETVTKLTSAYNTKALKYRGETIARTETIQAINRAEYASIKKLLDEGTIQQNQVIKWWDDVGDSHVRTTHRVMGEKYGRDKGIGLDEPFVSPSGASMMYPGDSSLGADVTEIANCRCVARYRVSFTKPFIDGDES